MPITKNFSCKHPEGEKIYLFSLVNSGGTEILISNYGAIITSFKIKKANGTINDIVLGFDKIEDYWSAAYLENYPWFGCAVGRYCNRIKNGKIKIDDQEYQLSKNKKDDTLHGGFNGFDKKVWQLVSMADEPFPALELKYISVDGEEGFPGNLETTIRFVLNDDNELSYEFKATTDKPTAINLTRHEYFNLDTTKDIINEHEIKINASYTLKQDDNLVVTGKEEAVDQTVFDLRNFYKIDNGLKTISEYDKSFLIDKRPDLLVAEAKSYQSNIHLQIFTTEPVVHFYSGKWIPFVPGRNGNLYGPFSGFCFETHKHPNAINIPDASNTILRPGENYYQKTIYKVII